MTRAECLKYPCQNVHLLFLFFPTWCVLLSAFSTRALSVSFSLGFSSFWNPSDVFKLWFSCDPNCWVVFASWIFLKAPRYSFLQFASLWICSPFVLSVWFGLIPLFLEVLLIFFHAYQLLLFVGRIPFPVAGHRSFCAVSHEVTSQRSLQGLAQRLLPLQLFPLPWGLSLLPSVCTTIYP